MAAKSSSITSTQAQFCTTRLQRICSIWLRKSLTWRSSTSRPISGSQQRCGEVKSLSCSVLSRTKVAKSFVKRKSIAGTVEMSSVLTSWTKITWLLPLRIIRSSFGILTAARKEKLSICRRSSLPRLVSNGFALLCATHKTSFSFSWATVICIS